MAQVSDALIEEVLQKTDIVDIVGEKVTLSKQGKSYFGLCPFHHEKTPSFSVEPERGIFNCFGCGEKGNAITFKQKTENLTFMEALEDLAIKAHVDFNFTAYKKENPFKKFYEINEDAKNFYRLYLTNTKQGQIAKEYLRTRGISDEIIQFFDLGLSPNEFDLLHKTLTAKDILVTDLYDLGLVKESSNDRFYDLFRERIIFPIHNDKGNVVAFSGRTYQEGDNSAKYINSPQTKVFTKSNVLYNLHNAINEVKRINRITLFEGYMDVIAAHRAGIFDGVASMGTSLTKEQVRAIKHYTSNVTICYDGDNAGKEATVRAIKLLRAENISIKVVTLPDKMDPDDYITKYGDKALKDYINNNWQDIFEYQYISNKENLDFTKMLDIERFKKTVFEMIANSSNAVIEKYILDLSKDTKISVDSIKQDFNQFAKKDVSHIRRINPQKVEIESKYVFAERRLLNYFLLDNMYLQKYRQELGPVFFIQHDVGVLIEKLEELYLEFPQNEEQTVDIKEQFLSKLDEAQKKFYFEKCVHRELDLLKQEYDDLIETMNVYRTQMEIDGFSIKIKESTSLEEKIKLAKYRDIKIKEDKHGQR